MQKFYNIRHGKSNLCRLLSTGQIETQHTLLVVQVCSTYNIYVGYLACTFSPGYLLPSLWYKHAQYIYVIYIWLYLFTWVLFTHLTYLPPLIQVCSVRICKGWVHLYFLLLFTQGTGGNLSPIRSPRVGIVQSCLNMTEWSENAGLEKALSQDCEGHGPT